MIAERQMTDMHRLGDVRAAEIDDHRPVRRVPVRRAAVARERNPRPVRQRRIGDIQMMKPGPAISTLAKSGSAFSLAAIFSAMARGLASLFRGAERAMHWIARDLAGRKSGRGRMSPKAPQPRTLLLRSR